MNKLIGKSIRRKFVKNANERGHKFFKAGGPDGRRSGRATGFAAGPPCGQARLNDWTRAGQTTGSCASQGYNIVWATFE